jgi:hypothetical protein
MAPKMGLWIDHRKAVIVEVTDQVEENQLVLSRVFKQPRQRGDSPFKDPYEAQLAPTAGNRETDLPGTLNIYYDTVMTKMTDADSIFIFGPDEAKDELKKRIENGQLICQLVEIEAADKMTDQQIMAKITEYFQNLNSHQLQPRLRR